TTVSGANDDDGGRLTGVRDRVLLAGYFKSEMSEYDSGLVFVPLDYLQTLRGMPDRATSIQIKLKDYAHAIEVRDALRELFPAHTFQVATWEDKQTALLFMIVGVAGFGILAIFSMIVVEKTRDIGILKALGASNRGVMGIFLGYGLLLGIVGAGLGTALGLSITYYINGIESWLSWATGQEI